MSLTRLTQAENATPSQTPVTAKEVAAGYVSTCAVTDAGGVKCWGRNDFGQLGNNSVENSGIPIDVIGLNSGVNRIAVGYKHACALMNTGGVKCWGLNRSGQLGNNSMTNAKTPVDVVGLTSGVRAITAGWEHTCALMSAGGVKCWGLNELGQLGNNSTENSKTPVDVATLGSGVSFIVTKGDFTCAITNLGAAKCWGDNAAGQLGNDSTSNAKTPVDVATLSSGVSTIAVNTFEACAILTTGVIKCWGGYGENAGETFGSKTPVEVQALSGKMTTLMGSVNNMCGITKNGALQCWGPNYAGQLGNGERTNRETPKASPAEVIGLGSGVTMANGGWGHICAIANASLKCWGANDSGQVGNGLMASSALPTSVVGIAGDTNAIGSGGFPAVSFTHL
ncbi:MAG: RCC1 repeat-containing protein, partial [Anaerolineae bacterium]|nr:RCC1 repeat-containing protein [Anaerolineae bacterium]